MTKYLKIMLTITLFFGACAGLTWYVVSFHAGDFLKDKLHAISERHGYELQTESIHVFPAGLVSMHGIKIRNVNEEENFLSISKVMCSFRPLAIFSESRLAPSCYVEGALLKDSPKGILDRLRDVTEKLNKNTDSTVGDGPGNSFGGYVASPWKWTWVVRWATGMDHAVAGDGLIVFYPPVDPVPATIQGNGKVTHLNGQVSPYFLDASIHLQPFEVRSGLLGFPRYLSVQKDQKKFSLWRLRWSNPILYLDSVGLALDGHNLTAQQVAIEDRRDFGVWADQLLTLLKFPGSIKVQSLHWTRDEGTETQVTTGHWITTTTGTSANLQEIQHVDPKNGLVIEIPEVKLSPVSLGRWKSTLSEADLMLSEPTATFTVKEGIGNPGESPIKGVWERAIQKLLREKRNKRDEPGASISDVKGTSLSELPAYLPRTTIKNGSMIFASKDMANAQEIEGIRRISGSWKKVGNEGVFELSANLDSSSEELSAATLVGAYHFYKGRLMRLKARTSNTLFPQLLKEISSKFVVKEDAEVSLTLDLDLAHPSLWFIKGKLRASGLGFDWWRIAPTPVENLSFNTSIDASFDRTDRRFTLSLPDLKIAKADLSLKLALENLSGAPFIDLKLLMPKQPCSFAFGAIPEAMIPRLRSLRVAGDVEIGLQLKLDTADPYSLKLNIDSDLESCTVLRLGDHMDMSKLRDPTFIHRPYVEGEELQVEVGPGTESWIPFYRIPSYVAMAAVATEDLDFFVHQGFKVSLIRRAMKLNLDKERYVYGGSTISQQLVKNLFLSREKNLSRKLEEAILTWQMEREIDKYRILELYLNCIEYGPGIYGIANGAYHYFNKTVEALTPLEGAFLMGLKPCPSCGFRQWKRRGVNKRWQSKLEFIMNRLHKRGWITDEQFLAGNPYEPQFQYDHLSDVIAP